MQQGGKIIGQGTYGCVFSPPLLCKSKPAKSGYLGKISEYADVKNEIQAAKDLGTVSKYFVLPDVDSLCIPDPMTKQTDPDIKKCTPIKLLGTDKMVSYQMKFGGLPIRVVLRKSATYSYFTFMRQLLEIGSILLLNGYVHGDFHMNNVLMLENHEPRLIDFGRSYPAKGISETLIENSWTEYSPGFPYESPDMSLVISTHSEVEINECILDMYTQKSSMMNVERILGVPRKTQMTELLAFWQGSKSAATEDWVSYWKTYWPSFDAWAVGAILLELLRARLLSKDFDAEWSKRQEIIEGVLKGLLHSSPRKRLDCLEALSLVDPTNPYVVKGASWLKARLAR